MSPNRASVDRPADRVAPAANGVRRAATAAGRPADGGGPEGRACTPGTRTGPRGGALLWEEAWLRFPGSTMPVLLTGTHSTLTGLEFGTSSDHADQLGGARREPDAFAGAVQQLQAYAAGELTSFDLPLVLTGTPFQSAVWSALTRIPYGRTVTYGYIAEEVGRPGSARAVGAAVGSNPIGIIVPCHRVIGANGSLTGFGGGLPNKVTLLAREGITAF